MVAFWFYTGTVALTGEYVESPYSIEEALVAFEGWDTGAPKYKPLPS
jgi:hypothetical protein